MRRLLSVLAMTLGPAAAGQPPAPTPLPEPVPPEEPVLRTTGERAWTLSLRLEAASDEAFVRRGVVDPQGTPRPQIVLDERGRYSLDRAAIVFPVLERTSTHVAIDGGLASSLRFEGDVEDDAATLLPGYQAGERLGRWDASFVENVDTMRLWIDLPMTARSVDFDEARALAIGWPEGPWPAVCASALLPQLAIDPDHEAVRELVIEAVGPAPYEAPPALIAKRLAAAVIDRFQPNGIGFEYSREGQFAGIELDLESRVAERLVGSPADMAALYVALLRSAGIPSRVVIGYDLFAAPEGRSEELGYLPAHCGARFGKGDFSALPRLHYWAEMALYDEGAGTLEWIPVDVIRQREFSSRPPALDQPWLFFGNHPCAEALLPISHHFFPPTTVVGAGAPLMWGWIAVPATPAVSQTLRVWASGTPATTGGEMVTPGED